MTAAPSMIMRSDTGQEFINKETFKNLKRKGMTT